MSVIIGPISMDHCGNSIVLLFQTTHEARDFFNRHTVKRVAFTIEQADDGTYSIVLTTDKRTVVRSGYTSRDEAVEMMHSLQEATR